jgi:tRNA threonylcarbamoyl adenosine modification protein YeaZ
MIAMIDSVSLTQTGIVILKEGAILGHRSWPSRASDRLLVFTFDQLLQELNLTYGALDQIAFAKGPGSFTGIRVGLAAAKGFGLALDKPIYGFSIFEAWAYYYAQKTQIPRLLHLICESGSIGKLHHQSFFLDAGSILEHHALRCILEKDWQEIASTLPNSAWVCGDIASLKPNFLDFFSESALLCKALGVYSGLKSGILGALTPLEPRLIAKENG